MQTRLAVAPVKQLGWEAAAAEAAWGVAGAVEPLPQKLAVYEPGPRQTGLAGAPAPDDDAGVAVATAHQWEHDAFQYDWSLPQLNLLC